MDETGDAESGSVGLQFRAAAETVTSNISDPLSRDDIMEGIPPPCHAQAL